MRAPKVAAATILTALVAGLVYFSSGAARSLQDKPIRISSRVVSEFKAPPPTLTEMVHAADAVIVGRVAGAAPRDSVESGVAASRIMTSYRVQVSEVLQALGGYPIDPREVSVLRIGGDRDRGAYVERSVHQDFPQFEIGHEYLLFLVWNKYYDSWDVAFGPDGAFELAKDGVTPLGTSDIAKALQRKGKDNLLEDIRLLKN